MYLQLLQEKDTEYNALVKKLKDRIINLEQELQDTQRKAGYPVELPYDSASLRLTPQMSRRQPPKPLFQKLDTGLSDTEISDLSPDGDDDKTATVERKIPVKDELDAVMPPHELLDSSANKSKCELVSRGGLAKRQAPSSKKSLSNSSSDCALNESEDDAGTVSDTTTSNSNTENGGSHHNGHFNNNNNNNILMRQRAAASAARAAATASIDNAPPLYAQVHKDRDGTRSVDINTAANVVVTAHSHFLPHSTIPNIYKNSTTSNEPSSGQMAASGSFNNDLNSSYDSIIGSNDKLSESGQNSDNWMYPSRRRGGPKNPPTSFTDQLNQVLSEREKCVLDHFVIAANIFYLLSVDGLAMDRQETPATILLS